MDVFAEPDAPQPMTTIENPKSAEGLNVGPVVFLANGPIDPSADWVNVLLPIRPNGSDGWVRRSDVTLTANQFHIEVRLGAHQIRVFDGAERVMQAPIGVGTSNTPTPGGAFYIRSLIASTDPAYGTYAFGLSGFSEVHDTFNGGPGDIGIHGTSDPGTIGTDVSNGCIRLEDGNVIRLAGLLPEAAGPAVGLARGHHRSGRARPGHRLSRPTMDLERPWASPSRRPPRRRPTATSPSVPWPWSTARSWPAGTTSGS